MPDLTAGPIPGTLVIAGLLFVITVATTVAGSGPDVLLRFGALRGDLVWDRGEWWRLGTAPWLHAGWIHFVFNVSALLQLGALVERLQGTTRMGVIYFVSAWTGALMSTWATRLGPMASVGASGAILGLAGFLLIQSWFAERPVRVRLRQLFGRRLLASVLLTFALGLGLALVVPLVDNMAHVGGLLGGALLGLMWRRPLPSSRPWLAAVGAAVALWSAGLAAARGGAAVETMDRDLSISLLAHVTASPEGVTAGVRLAEAAQRTRAAGLDIHASLGVTLRAVADPTTLSVASSVLYEADEQGGEDSVALGLILERWSEVAPEDPVALNALAWYLLFCATPDPQRAERLSELAIGRVDSVDRALFAQVADTRAEALLQTGRFAEALVLQRRAVAAARAEAPDLLPALLARLAKATALSH